MVSVKEALMVERRLPAIFMADSLGLNILNSIATSADRPVDWLDNDDGLLSWLVQDEPVPAKALYGLTTSAMPGASDKIVNHGRALREWCRGFVRKHKGRPLTRKALDEVVLLESDEAFSQILRRNDDDSDRLELRLMGR
jgi:hypothetical protein